MFSKWRQDDFQPGILHPADPSGKPKSNLAAYSREVEDMKLLLSLGRRRQRMLTQLQGKGLGGGGRSCSVQNKARAHSKTPEAEDPQQGKVTFDLRGCRADLPPAHLFCSTLREFCSHCCRSSVECQPSPGAQPPKLMLALPHSLSQPLNQCCPHPWVETPGVKQPFHRGHL